MAFSILANHEMKANEKIGKYLGLVQDETLSEHDARYHGGHFEKGMSCGKREGMKPGDTTDDLERIERMRKWLQNLPDFDILSEYMHKYDDDKHPTELNLIMEEIKRREPYAIEDYLTRMGERV